MMPVNVFYLHLLLFLVVCYWLNFCISLKVSSEALTKVYWWLSAILQLDCRFDIMDSIFSFFVFWHMQLYMTWYIISFFWLYLYYLNILYFFKYSCTNIFHRHGLCTFYNSIPSALAMEILQSCNKLLTWACSVLLENVNKWKKIQYEINKTR